MTESAQRAAWIIGIALLFAFCSLTLRVDNSITHFMPTGEEAELAAISRKLIDSELSRTMILSIGGGAAPLDVAAGLADALHEHPEVASLRTGLDDAQLEALHALYFPRLAYFASDQPARELPELLSPEGLRSRAAHLRDQLASPASTLVAQLAPSDPLSLFARVVERFRAGEATLELEDGQFVSADGRHAILFLETRASPFDSEHQADLLAAIDTTFAELDQQHGGGHVLEQSGVNRIALSAERSMREDIFFISILSFFGVSGLFLLFFRSPHSLLIAILPPFAGICVATAAEIVGMPSVHGVTLAFGVALIGVAIDYPVHVMNHHAIAPAPNGARGTVQRLRPSLALGALTTIASFLALTLTSFPGVGEMGTFAALGIAAAFVVTLYALPAFLDTLPSPPAVHRATAVLLGNGVMRLRERPAWLIAVPLVTSGIAVVGLSRLEWEDDPAALTTLDAELQAEDHRVRQRVSQFEPGRFVIALAGDPDSALELNDQAWLRIERAIEAGHLEGARSLHAMLWSTSLQRRNLALFRAEADLSERIDTAFTSQGFRSGSFHAFTEPIESRDGMPPPLRFDDLTASPLGDVARSMLVQLGDRWGAITYLRSVHDPDGLQSTLDGLPDVHYFDQQELLRQIYAGYRPATLRVIVLGSVLVFGVLWLRYRKLRNALAAFLPSALMALSTLGLFGLLGIRVNLMGLIGLILVMGMGVDYCIFMLDSAVDPRHLGATATSLIFSGLTTVFVFGVLAISVHPALRAIGLTTCVGIGFALLLAPSALLLDSRTQDFTSGEHENPPT